VVVARLGALAAQQSGLTAILHHRLQATQLTAGLVVCQRSFCFNNDRKSRPAAVIAMIRRR